MCSSWPGCQECFDCRGLLAEDWRLWFGKGPLWKGLLQKNHSSKLYVIQTASLLVMISVANCLCCILHGAPSVGHVPAHFLCLSVCITCIIWLSFYCSTSGSCPSSCLCCMYFAWNSFSGSCLSSLFVCVSLHVLVHVLFGCLFTVLLQGRVPARWMALESLEERTHTSKSDV